MGKYNNYMTQEEKDKIISLHEEGFNTVQIAEKINRNNSSVGRYLKKMGYSTRNTRNLTFKDIENIKKMYIDGMTSREIFEKYKDKIKCEETIQVLIRKNNLARPRGFRNIINHDYFEKIDTPEKAYFLGFMVADGNVYKFKNKRRQGAIQLALHYKDKYIVDIFKREICTDNKVIEYKSKNRHECTLIVHSDKMANDLSKYGIIPNKTYLIDRLPCVPNKLLPDLIRGVFDGDGTVFTLKSNGKLRFGFCGTHNLMSDILDKLSDEIGTPKNKITDVGNVSHISFAKKKDILTFYNYIYYSDEVLCLERKRIILENFIAK